MYVTQRTAKAFYYAKRKLKISKIIIFIGALLEPAAPFVEVGVVVESEAPFVEVEVVSPMLQMLL